MGVGGAVLVSLVATSRVSGGVSMGLDRGGLGLGVLAGHLAGLNWVRSDWVRVDWVGSHGVDWVARDTVDWVGSNRVDWVAGNRVDWVARDSVNWVAGYRVDWVARNAVDGVGSNRVDWVGSHGVDWVGRDTVDWVAGYRVDWVGGLVGAAGGVGRWVRSGVGRWVSTRVSRVRVWGSVGRVSSSSGESAVSTSFVGARVVSSVVQRWVGSGGVLVVGNWSSGSGRVGGVRSWHLLSWNIKQYK
jgi:hypothetical protein